MISPLLYTVGPRYDLPLPLTTFQWAGAAVVGISFVMMTIFASHRTGPSAIRYPRREVAALNWVPGSSPLHTIGGLIGVVGLLTVIGISTANLFAATVIIEQIFSIPGLGLLLFNSVTNHDSTTVLGCIF